VSVNQRISKTSKLKKH